MSKLKSKVHLKVYTHAHTQVHKRAWCVHPPLPVPKRERLTNKNPRSVGVSSSTGMSPCGCAAVETISFRSTFDLDVRTI